MEMNIVSRGVVNKGATGARAPVNLQSIHLAPVDLRKNT